MPRLALILRDCYPSPVNQPARAALPRLAALEYCLARADRAPLLAGWQSWLAGRLGGAELQTAALGGIAAAGRPDLRDARHYWLATPVNYVAGIDNLRLHPSGLLRLTEQEQQLLTQDFARVFAGSGWELLATGQRELLLAGPAHPLSSGVDPARLLGRDPSPSTQALRNHPSLRRLSSECEMWLHEHAINRARSAAGLLSVSGLWFWGGGPIAAAVSRHPGRVFSDDLLATSLARTTGASLSPLPAAWSEVSVGALDEQVIVVMPLSGESAVTELQDLERNWLAPMLSQWRRGQCPELVIVAGDQCATVPRAGRWRWWRPTPPWWESLFAC